MGKISDNAEVMVRKCRSAILFRDDRKTIHAEERLFTIGKNRH